MPSWGVRVRGGVVNVWFVKPFETVPVIKGYTNKIEIHLVELMCTSAMIVIMRGSLFD